MLEDLRAFLPFERADIARTWFNPHLEEALYSNDVGAWQFRPEAVTELDNLYLAADYCSSAIDMVCQEGAVVTGLLADEAVRTAAGIAEPIEILEPAVPPRWQLVAAKLALFPVAAIARAFVRSGGVETSGVGQAAGQRG
jgi:hypothetical protein